MVGGMVGEMVKWWIGCGRCRERRCREGGVAQWLVALAGVRICLTAGTCKDRDSICVLCGPVLAGAE